MGNLENEAKDEGTGPEQIPTADYGEAAVGPGAQIGPYKLVSILGEGGYGIVYLAEQQRPVKRRVALKVIKPGMDTKQVIARFEAERQALALLDHPNIAHVFSAGATEAERPYFAMEYVKGVPITEHCDRSRLTINERLALFLAVCEAVQHAHQKGIIHRDIKPSNILVFFENERAIPKVIDFGIAKAISQPLTERTLYTERGQLVGTLEYMSPEQAEMTGQDIDTRSDIYSLGVVLYELLTGVLPFESETLRQGGPDHLRQVIREEEPKTPSTCLSRLTRADCTRVAGQRRSDADSLRRKLRGDLDWITLKAMEKDRTRRYGSAGELAADIRRHLNDEPVAAGPPSTLYHMCKCIRRHQALTTGLAAVLLVLLVGVAGIVFFAIKADRQARAAQAVTDFLGQDLLGSIALQQAMSQQVTVRSILDAAAERLEGNFGGKPLVEASIRQYLGQAYIELGDYQQAEPHLQRAHDLHRRDLDEKDLLTLDSANQLGRLYMLQGRYKEAEPLLTQALASRRRLLGPDHPDTLQTSVWLGMVCVDLDRLDRAEELLPRAFESCDRLLGKQNLITLEAMYGLGFLRVIQARHDEVASLVFEGWQLARNVVGEGHRLTLDFMIQGAWFEARDGQFEQAVSHARTGLETCLRVLGKEHPQTIMAMGGLGHIYAMQHKCELAEPLLVESTELGDSILGPGHDWILFYRFILGDVLVEQGQYQRAESLYEEVLADARRVLPEGNMILRNTMPRMRRLYAVWERADKLQDWCSQELQWLAQANDGGDSSMAAILNDLAWLQATYPSAAIRDGAKAIENARKACELSGWNRATFIDTLAAAYAEAGDFVAAVREEEKAIELVTRRGGTSVPTGFVRRLSLYKSGRAFRESVLTIRARARIAEAKYDAAEQELTALLTSLRQYVGETHPEMRGCILAFVELYEVWGRPEEAQRWRSQLPPEE